MPRIIGIFGGTFDPVHYGHTKTISQLLSIIPFKKVVVIPSAKPPHKERVIASFEDRIAMTRLAFKNQKKVLVDGREALRSGPSYAIDTVKDFLTEEKNTQIVLILGSDAFAKIDTWHMWKELFGLANFVVIKRPYYPVSWRKRSLRAINRKNNLEDLTSSEGTGKVIEIKLNPIQISSSKIRKGFTMGKNVERLVGSKVREYLISHQVYGSENSIK